MIGGHGIGQPAAVLLRAMPPLMAAATAAAAVAAAAAAAGLAANARQLSSTTAAVASSGTASRGGSVSKGLASICEVARHCITCLVRNSSMRKTRTEIFPQASDHRYRKDSGRRQYTNLGFQKCVLLSAADINLKRHGFGHQHENRMYGTLCGSRHATPEKERRALPLG